MAPRVALVPLMAIVLAACFPLNSATPTPQGLSAATRSIGVRVTSTGPQPSAIEAARLARLRGKMADMERVAQLQTKSPDGQGLTTDERDEEQRILTSWQDKYGEPWDNNDLPSRITALKQQLSSGTGGTR